jgi:hypothetical protein
MGASIALSWGALKSRVVSISSNGCACSQRLLVSKMQSGVSHDTIQRINAKSNLRESTWMNPSFDERNGTAALALSPGRDVKVAAALTLARVGDALRAKALAEELEKSYPTNTMLKLYWLPTIIAAIELNKGNSSQATGGRHADSALTVGVRPSIQSGATGPSWRCSFCCFCPC